MAFNWKDKADEQIVKFVRTQQGWMANRRRLQGELREKVVKVFRPRRYDILSNYPKGKQYGAKVFDQAPANALAKFVGGKIGYMVSRQVPWVGFVPVKRELMRSDRVKQHMQDAADQILYAASRSNLYTSLVPHGMDAHSIATSCMVPMRDRVKDRVVFDVVHPKDSYLMVDRFVDPIGYHRTMKMTNVVALEWFDRAKLPDVWFEQEKGGTYGNQLKSPLDEHDYIWAWYPNDDRYNNSKRAADKPFKVLCVLLGRGKTGSLMLNSGDDVFPICWRSLPESGWEYGTSLSMDCLTSALVTTVLGQKRVTAAHLAVEPRTFASDTLRRTLRRNPGGTTWVSNINQEGVKSWDERLQWPITYEEMRDIRAQIDDRFYIRFFEMLSSGDFDKVKTAYEISQMMGEKAVLMSTIVDTFEKESLEPAITALVKDEERAGRMPPVPDELLDSGGKINIRYIGPLHQLQQTLLRGKSITDAVAVIQMMGELDQFVPLKFDFMEMAEEVTVAGGLPQRMIKSDEEVKRIIDETVQRQQAMEQAEVAEKAGSAAGNLSKPIAPDSALAGMAAGVP